VNTTTNHRIDGERGKVIEGASAREKRAYERERESEYDNKPQDR
jgi:hypothetical protein